MPSETLRGFPSSYLCGYTLQYFFSQCSALQVVSSVFWTNVKMQTFHFFSIMFECFVFVFFFFSENSRCSVNPAENRFEKKLIKPLKSPFSSSDFHSFRRIHIIQTKTWKKQKMWQRFWRGKARGKRGGTGRKMELSAVGWDGHSSVWVNNEYLSHQNKAGSCRKVRECATCSTWRAVGDSWELWNAREHFGVCLQVSGVCECAEHSSDTLHKDKQEIGWVFYFFQAKLCCPSPAPLQVPPPFWDNALKHGKSDT